jgi:anti-anti-sigma factor
MHHQPFSITTRHDPDGRLRVIVRGELDLLTSPRLAQRLHRLCSPGRPVVVDLGGVTFIDASAIHVLEERVRAGCHLTVACPRLLLPMLEHLMALAGAVGEAPFQLDAVAPDAL